MRLQFSAQILLGDLISHHRKFGQRLTSNLGIARIDQPAQGVGQLRRSRWKHLGKVTDDAERGDGADLFGRRCGGICETLDERRDLLIARRQVRHSLSARVRLAACLLDLSQELGLVI